MKMWNALVWIPVLHALYAHTYKNKQNFLRDAYVGRGYFSNFGGIWLLGSVLRNSKNYF